MTSLPAWDDDQKAAYQIASQYLSQLDAKQVFALMESIVDVVRGEREACAQTIEHEEFVIAWYEDSERPTQVSHVDMAKTLENAAAAIRARGNS